MDHSPPPSRDKPNTTSCHRPYLVCALAPPTRSTMGERSSTCVADRRASVHFSNFVVRGFALPIHQIQGRVCGNAREVRLQQANEGRGCCHHLRAREPDRLLVWGRDGRASVHFPNFICPRLCLVSSGTVPSGIPRAHRARMLLPFQAGTGGGMALIVRWGMPARKNRISAHAIPSHRHKDGKTSRFTAAGV